MILNQFIFTIDGKVYDLPDQLKDIPDYTVFRALSASAYADDFVGPPRPVMRGELGELLGFKIVDFPYVPPVKAAKIVPPPRQQGLKKHWRRW